MLSLYYQDFLNSTNTILEKNIYSNILNEFLSDINLMDYLNKVVRYSENEITYISLEDKEKIIKLRNIITLLNNNIKHFSNDEIENLKSLNGYLVFLDLFNSIFYIDDRENNLRSKIKFPNENKIKEYMESYTKESTEKRLNLLEGLLVLQKSLNSFKLRELGDKFIEEKENNKRKESETFKLIINSLSKEGK